MVKEQYNSKVDLFNELYEAIKPVFNIFGICEKYWDQNIEAFLNDFKSHLGD